MTGPERDGVEPGTADRERWRDELAAKWAFEVSTTIYIPMSRAGLEEYLGDLVDLLAAAIEDESNAVELCRRVGERLVKANISGEWSLHRSLEILGPGLLSGPRQRTVEPIASRVVSLLGFLATGYIESMRELMFDQQESVKKALLHAKVSTERELWVSENRFREVFSNAPMGIAITDLDGKFVETNDAFGDVLLYSGEQFDERTMEDLFTEESEASLREFYRMLSSGQQRRFRMQAKLLRADGVAVPMSLAVSLLRDADGEPSHHVTMMEDISDLQFLQDRFYHQTLHDSLTGLPNRQFFFSRLESALTNLPPDEQLTLYHLDLDGFGVLNDGLGHEAGDTLLCAVAGRLRELVDGEEAVVARFGADEFVILLLERETTPDVASFAQTINLELAEPIYLGDHGVAATAGIGVVRDRERRLDASETVRAAESALRVAKTSGKRQWAMFDPAKAATERTQSALASVLPGALESGELEVGYRPAFRLDDGEPVGVEALVGWNPSEHRRWPAGEEDTEGPQPSWVEPSREIDEHGWVDHDTCTELAERTGATLPMRDWVLHTACERMLWWCESSGRELVLAMSLSPFQASDPDLVAAIRRLLANTGLPPERLWLWMPTQTVLDSRTETVDNVHVLADTGVGIGLHEFGMSSGDLFLLEELPIRTVRIADHTVLSVRGKEESSPAVRAVAEMVPLVKEAGYTVLVGCVTSVEQARWWRSIGVEVALGDHFHPVGTADEMDRLFSG